MNKNETDQKFVSIPENEMNKELKSRIFELERLGVEYCRILQKKYEKIFEKQGKYNIRLWISRDIDGDEIDGLSSENCLEKEYRSQITIDYDDQKFDDDLYADTFLLWYYFGGYWKGSGSLYDLSKNDLYSDVEDTLIMLIK